MVEKDSFDLCILIILLENINVEKFWESYAKYSGMNCFIKPSFLNFFFFFWIGIKQGIKLHFPVNRNCFSVIFPISVDSHDLRGNQIPQVMTSKLIHETVMASCEFIAFEERTPKSTLMATPLEEPCQTVTFQRLLSLEQ